MTKQVMDRKAADNKYLHKDFHIYMSFGVDYVGKKYGLDGVREYLAEFTRNYHKPLIQDIRQRGLDAVQDYLARIYAAEEVPEDLEMTRSASELSVLVKRCPAVTHIRKQGGTPSRWFAETTSTVYATLALEAGISFEMIDYREDDGRAQFRFLA